MGCIMFLTFAALQIMRSFSSASMLFGNLEDICGPEEEIALTGSGLMDTVIISLTPTDPEENCILQVVAPNTHLVKLQFVESTSELHRARIFNQTFNNPPCIMNVFLPQNRRKAVWTGDPCSSQILPEIDLLTPQFRIVWKPPKDPSYTKGRKIVLTAVGKGDVCLNSGQHVCSKIGWQPNLCVSEHLVCDGNENCPNGASTSDEDDRLCKSNPKVQLTFEQIVADLVKKIKPPTQLYNNKWLQSKLKDPIMTTTQKSKLISWRDWQEFRITQVQEATTKQTVQEKLSTAETITEVLSHYGPWGYLMLGMLICGTVLMFCGLWECCCRKPKPHPEEPVPRHPTTVLILNHQQEAAESRPPSYEELDQPPPYSVLFPNSKEDQGRSGVQVSNDTVGRTTNESGDAVQLNIDQGVVCERECHDLEVLDDRVTVEITVT